MTDDAYEALKRRLANKLELARAVVAYQPVDAEPLPDGFVDQAANQISEEARQLFEDTGNPLAVWALIGRIVETDRPWPAWVLNYLARVAAEFSKLSANPPRDPTVAVAAVLGFAPRGKGPGSEFRDFRNARRRQRAVAQFVRFVLIDGTPTYPAAAMAAVEAEVRDDTVINWAREHFGVRGPVDWRMVLLSALDTKTEAMLGLLRLSRPS